MICPFDHARSQNQAKTGLFSGQDTANPHQYVGCPYRAKVVPQVGHRKALETLDVSHRPTCLAHLRVRVYTRTHMRVEVGRWDTASKGKGYLRPTCGTTSKQVVRGE